MPIESENTITFNFSENDLVGPSEVNYVHEGNEPYKCSICDYKCSEMGDLDNHISSVHDGNYQIVPGHRKNSKLYQLNGFLYRINCRRPRNGPTEKNLFEFSRKGWNRIPMPYL